MNFYERYAESCHRKGIEPCSQKAADIFGITKATISTWNKKKTCPKGETISIIADKLEVSCDYLLGKTDNTTINKELTPDEEKLLKYYRATNEQGKKTIIGVAEMQPQELISSASKIG